MPPKTVKKDLDDGIGNGSGLRKLRFDAVVAVMEFGSNQDRGEPFQKAQAIVEFVNNIPKPAGRTKAGSK